MIKILIVDDSTLDRRLMMSVLQKNGVKNELLQAPDGEEALKILGGNFKDIGLILLDWQMPKMNGIDFMKAVMKVPPVAVIPIVMVTASGSEDNKRQAKEANPHLAGYIVKPYKAEDLLNIIRPYILDVKG